MGKEMGSIWEELGLGETMTKICYLKFSNNKKNTQQQTCFSWHLALGRSRNFTSVQDALSSHVGDLSVSRLPKLLLRLCENGECIEVNNPECKFCKRPWSLPFSTQRNIWMYFLPFKNLVLKHPVNETEWWHAGQQLLVICISLQLNWLPLNTI